MFCELNEQDIPEICSYGAEVSRNNADKRRIDRILDHHQFDLDSALESELKAWEVWEKVNAGKR
jgi:hypothetical protein